MKRKIGDKQIAKENFHTFVFLLLVFDFSLIHSNQRLKKTHSSARIKQRSAEIITNKKVEEWKLLFIEKC